MGARPVRLLDALADAGGPQRDADKTEIQITRGETVAVMPFAQIFADPMQNVPMRAGDIVSVTFQPYRFIALGALTTNAEIPFSGAGISLAQALSPTGGLREDRADIRGVFVFRFEEPEALPALKATGFKTTREGEVPVVYRLDLSGADGFFHAQDFAVRDDDLIYVSTAPGADLQLFLSTLSSVALSSIAIGGAVR